jgi:tRNA (guanine37-N1)-methyltransferase
MSQQKRKRMTGEARSSGVRSPVGEKVALESGVDIIGDLAIVKFPDISVEAKRGAGEELMREMKNVKGVFEQVGGIEGDFRLRKLSHIAGEKRSMTIHKENGCVFKVDISKCYYSPRLSTERLRVAEMVGPTESVLNMFAGVGPFSITIAKKRRSLVTSCELSDYAYQLHLENNILNKVADRVTTIRADAMDLPSLVHRKFDRVVMPHPSQSHKFLKTALAMCDKGSAIHYYRHVLGRTFAEGRSNLVAELESILGEASLVQVRKAREVGPRWLELVADLRVNS